MSADCYLMSCRSREDAKLQARALFGTGEEEEAAGHREGPIDLARYANPLFWLAAFETGDGFLFDRIRPEEDGLPAERYAVLCFWSPTAAAVKRLKRRREMILAYGGEHLDGFYDEWIEFVETGFPEAILLQPEDISGLEGIENGNGRLANAIKTLDSAEATAGLPDTKVLYQVNAAEEAASRQRSGERWTPKAYAEFRRFALAGSDGDAWPPPPSEVELLAAAAAVEELQSKKWWKFWA